MKIMTGIFLTALTVLLYLCAELAMRCGALNRVSHGVLGWCLLGAVGTLVFVYVVVPLMFSVRFPVWRNISEFTDSRDKWRFLEKYADWLLKRFSKDAPDVIHDDMEHLRRICSRSSADDYYAALEKSVLKIHDLLIGDVCNEIIERYMKRTAIIVALSQRGWIDSLALLVMQGRMITEQCRYLGFRPSWVLILKCYLWISLNSILFALFDASDVLEGAFNDLIPLAVGDKVAASIPFAGKLMDSGVQGLTAMAVVYSSGKIVQAYLLGNAVIMRGEERVRLRVEGYANALGVFKNK